MSDETPHAPEPETPATPEASAAPDTEVPDAPDAVPDAAATAPTEETTVPTVAADDTPPVAAPAAAPVAAAPMASAATATKERKSVAVPMSVLVTLGAILVAALMFGIGYAVGNSNDDDNAAVSTPIGNGNFPIPNQGGNPGSGNQQAPTFPQLPGGNQGGNSNPNNPNTPNNPNSPNSGGNQQTSSPPFIGIATQQTQGGLQVTEVVQNSAAQKAGLEAGDVITEFDGDAVTTPAQLANAVAQHDVGDDVELTFTRNGQTRTVTVTLGSRTTSN